jgi:hypothetical protein
MNCITNDKVLGILSKPIGSLAKFSDEELSVALDELLADDKISAVELKDEEESVVSEKSSSPGAIIDGLYVYFSLSAATQEANVHSKVKEASAHSETEESDASQCCLLI